MAAEWVRRSNPVALRSSSPDSRDNRFIYYIDWKYRAGENHKYLVPIYVFPETKLCSLVISRTELYSSVSQFLHSCICERFIYMPGSVCYLAAARNVDRSWEYINCSQSSQAHEFRHRDWGCAIPFLGIHKWDFRCSVEGYGSANNIGKDSFVY